jgi:cell division protein FtsI/penicillin-binding protein 2
MQEHAVSLQYEQKGRINAIAGIFMVATFLLLSMLVDRQIIEHRRFSDLALKQRLANLVVPAERGKILVDEKSDNSLYPLATNVTLFALTVVPNQVKRPELTASKLMPFLDGTGIEESYLITKMSSGAHYMPPLKRKISEEEKKVIDELNLDGVYLVPEQYRYFPEGTMAASVLGFVNRDGKGQYGLEEYFDKQLGGKAGQLEAEVDSFGRQIALGKRESVDPENGLDVVTTIDRAVQYYVEKRLKEAVEKHQAEKGSVVIMEPKTGKIIAMASYPNFDPNSYNKEPIENFTNVNLQAYEPGSVFKVITMAAGLDSGVVSPNTTYTDTGEAKIDDRTIKNSTPGANGVQTMTQVLEKSLNTGMIFVVQKLGKYTFNKYVTAFGFSQPTGVELANESSGRIKDPKSLGEVDLATSSFGQGIAVTPLQMVAAITAIANDGKLMQPHLVDRILYPSGAVSIDPTVVGQPIKSEAAEMVTAMMVNVVEVGHGKRAGVPGYYIAGKTGTAQIPAPNGGYLDGVGSTIGTFVGFGPVEDPRFVMLTRVDKPRDVQFAESSAAPLFGDIAKFLLDYWHIPPTR